MHRIYEIWKAYAMVVVEAYFAYCQKTENLPAVVSFGLLLAPMAAVHFFLPAWISLPLIAAILLPLLWFLGLLFYVFFTYEYKGHLPARRCPHG